MTDLLLPLAIFDAAQFFGWFVENANYLLVFVFMMIESSFIPFPSEVVVPPAAYLAAQNGSNMNVVGVVLAATAGAVAGALTTYSLPTGPKWSTPSTISTNTARCRPSSAASYPPCASSSASPPAWRG